MTVYFDLHKPKEGERRWIAKNLPELSAGNNGPVGVQKLEF